MSPEIAALAVNVKLCMALVAAGIIGSLLNRLYQLEQAGTIIPPLEYWRKHPYGVLLCVFSAYLLVIQLTVIDAVCPWCVATDCVLSVLTACCLFRLRAEFTPTSPAAPGPARSARGRRGWPDDASA
jgi:hypothetical protein